MAAVRLRDALRYAITFVGLLIVLAIVSGAFVAGGAYLAAGAISLTDPSLSAISETSVFIGVVLLGVGVLVAVVGLVALAHKFLTDGIAIVLDARDLGEAGTTVNGREETERESDDDRAAVAGSGAAASGTAGEATSAGVDSDDGSVDARGGSEHVTQPGETPPTTEPSPGPVGAPSEEPTADRATTAEGSDSIDEATTAPGTTEADSEPEEPPEWTPPDPSQFETPDPSETAEPDRVDEDRGIDEGPPTDGWTTDPDDDDVAEFEDDDAAEIDDDDAAEIDEDATLADEGVESFDTAGEEDPLSDRLPGDDDS